MCVVTLHSVGRGKNYIGVQSETKDLPEAIRLQLSNALAGQARIDDHVRARQHGCR